MELWDLDDDTSAAFSESTQGAQPYLVGNRESPPMATYNMSSNDWDLEPSSIVTDLAGETIQRPYLRVSPAGVGYMHKGQEDSGLGHVHYRRLTADPRSNIYTGKAT